LSFLHRTNKTVQNYQVSINNHRVNIRIVNDIS